jgi:hypothetical protein
MEASIESLASDRSQRYRGVESHCLQVDDFDPVSREHRKLRTDVIERHRSNASL